MDASMQRIDAGPAARDAGRDSAMDATTASNDAGPDDAGDDDAGTDAGPPPVLANYVFVTSTTHVPGELGGLQGADAICNDLAAAARLPGRYIAWLSSSSENAIDRLIATGARGWVRTDGLAVADDVQALVGGLNWYPIDRDELGQPRSGIVLTATAPEGTLSGVTCTDWTDATSATQVSGGNTKGMGGHWTSGNVPRCDGSVVLPRLYCFGVDRNADVAPEQRVGRIAFITAGLYAPGSGLSAADALCQDEAEAASRTGSFRALLATSAASALSRFDTSGSLWVRADLVPFVASIEQFAAGRPDTTVHVQADGRTYVRSVVTAWMGATTPGATVNASTCQDWMSDLETDRATTDYVLDASSFAGGSQECTAGPYRIYCLEE